MPDNYVAGLLQKHVERMTGVQRPIIPDDGPWNDSEIIIGFNRHFHQLGLEATKDSFGPEEFLIKTVGETLLSGQHSMTNGPFIITNAIASPICVPSRA